SPRTATSRARALRGASMVPTGPDRVTLCTCPGQGEGPGCTIEAPPYAILAQDEVRHVGDAVAFVVANTIERARDAAEAIAIDWEPLPAVIGATRALASDAPKVWPAGNLVFGTTIGATEAATRAFVNADRTVSLDVVNQRLAANYIDTRGVVAEYDPDADRLTLTLSSQGSHMVRDVLCNNVLRIPPERMRVVTPDVGGG